MNETINLSSNHPEYIRIKRLHYRSWHRGCKETDIILGKFADIKLPTLTTKELDMYEAFLDIDDAIIWEWLTKKSYPEDTGHQYILSLLG